MPRSRTRCVGTVDGDRRSTGAFEADVASLLTDGAIAEPGKRGDAGAARNDGKTRHGSGGDVDVHDLVLGRQRPTFALAEQRAISRILLPRFEVSDDGCRCEKPSGG